MINEIINTCYATTMASRPIAFYSHLIPVILSVLLAILVFIKAKGNFFSKIFFSFVSVFSLWLIGDLIIWTQNNYFLAYASWAPLDYIEIVFYALGLYFALVFVKKSDISVFSKAALFLLTVPPFILTVSQQSVIGFNQPVCEAFNNDFLGKYKLTVEGIMLVIILFYAIAPFFKKVSWPEKKADLVVLGSMFLFLSIFGVTEYLASATGYYEMNLYSLFLLPVFLIAIIYSVFELDIFNFHILGTHYLVIGLVVLTGGQLFLMTNTTNRLLTILTMVLIAGLSIILFRNSKRESDQRVQIAKLNLDLQIANKKIAADKKVVEKANQELIKLDKAKSEFIDIASHQLRTPISVISGVASMMLEGDIDKMPPEQKQKFYQSVWEKTQKLKIIVHDILNATSFTNRKFTVMDQLAEPVNLPELLERIIKDFEIEVKERDIDLTFSAGENIPKIRGQKEYLEESFVNLINNAVKYTPSSKMTDDIRGKREGGGRGKVAVTVKRDPNNAKNIMVEVKDNGIGIPAEAKAKLFQRFSRTQNAVDMYTDGTGLGLFIAKEVIEGHGGKIWFKSELNQGTTFFVSLPIKPEKNVNIKEYITKAAISKSDNLILKYESVK